MNAARHWQGMFALLNRSLRVEDRTLMSHLGRFGFVLFSYLIVLSTQSSSFAFGAPGLRLFSSMSYLNFICITLAATSFFATAISEEKEDMTLGLLKMAGVSAISLLLGKSTPRMIAAMVLLSAQLPFTMLAITLGGVSLPQVLAGYVCLLAYLVLVANMALFFSVISVQSRTAGTLSGLALGTFFFGPFLFGGMRGGMIYKGWWSDGATLSVLGFTIPIDAWFTESLSYVSAASPFMRVGTILSTGFSDSPISYQVLSNIGGGLVFFLAAWALFESSTRNELPAAEPRGLLFKRIGMRGALGPRRAWDAAICWKDFHFVAGGKISLLVKVLLYGFVIVLITWLTGWNRPTWNGRSQLEELGQFTMALSLWAFCVEMAVLASRMFYTESKWNTLSSLVLLPKTIGHIAYAKMAGAAIGLLPAAGYFLLGVAMAPKSFSEAFGDIITEPGAWYFASQVVLGIHLAAIFSLYFKWGALPMAIGAIYLGNAFLAIMAMFLFSAPGAAGDDGLLVIPAFVSIFLCVVIHFRVGTRLQQLAAR